MPALRTIARILPRRASAAPTARDWRLVRRIRSAANELSSATDRELRDRADDLRNRVDGSRVVPDDELLVASFSLVDEAARRAHGLSFYDVQLAAGLVLARGGVAEMQTGEGKTLVTALPAFARSLSGAGVHVSTANSYLARRDCDFLRPILEQLGATAGLTCEGVPPDRKRAAYACDVTFGPGYEFGFDYLRDQLTVQGTGERPLGETFLRLLRGEIAGDAALMQRGLAFAIVDEIDSVLIDDAGSPLLLSEPTGGQPEDAAAHLAARDVAERLNEGAEYTVDAAAGTVELTARGRRKAGDVLEHAARRGLARPWLDYVLQALWAKTLVHRGVHYVVDGDHVRIVDEFTGRIFADRSWRDGLHQSVEAKERLPISRETRPRARVTRQRFFRLYESVCGMTGTARGSEREFREFYGLGVTAIPLRTPSRRQMLPTRFFATADARYAAIADEVERLHASGRPVLIGTRTIAGSLAMSERLAARGLSHQLLNGTQDEAEADVVAGAGQAGAITVATNMAGRGTDIKLTPDVVARGGLCVIGAERHASSRIDRQLAGRCARQGDAGSARFYVSAEDDLLQRHARGLPAAMKRAAGASGEVALDLDRHISRIQRRVERQAWLRRRTLFHLDRRRDSLMSELAGGT
ncbi:MAG: preprotein translocase subunit SecA [Planctomycetes bacterium]|nr:preprotein translocase subunit SecA [Planctomycetota bacterium]